jgi:hypothetical protein
VDPTFVPRDERHWSWLYRANPSGSRCLIAVTDQGRVAAQYAGLCQRALLDGAPARLLQSVDSMADPSLRSGLTRKGPFVSAGLEFARRYGGAPPDRETIMWGFPERAAWRIGSRFLGYEFVRAQLLLRASAARVRAAGAEKAGFWIEEVARVPPDVSELFQRFARGRPAIAVRDELQLNWRFGDHPRNRYRIALARQGSTLRGLAVYRAGPFQGERGGLVCDWLVPPEDERAGRSLHRWLAECAEGDGAEHLFAIFPDTAPEWLAFQRLGFRVHPSRYILAARSYVERYSVAWLRKHWYYTLGDTDLC